MNSPSFESLRVWHDARALVRQIYALTHETLLANDASFCWQIRRAAISAMSNIAEGCERSTPREFARFLKIAKGSAGEVRSLLYAAEDLAYMHAAQAAILRAEAIVLARRIAALVRDVERKAALDR